MIDVHHHFEPTGRNVDGREWSIAAAVEELDRNAVARAIAYAGPIFERGDEGGRRARTVNEWSAGHVRAYPGRFGLFASIPMGDADRALTEIAYAFDVLRGDGIGISTHYAGEGLGEPRFRPILEELNRRRALVYVHPAGAPCESPPTPAYASELLTSPWIEFPTNTARTMLSLWSTQTTRQLPDIRFVFCHGGGTMPMLLGRFAGFRNWFGVGERRLAELFPDGVYAEFAKCYFDCAQAYAPETIAMLRSIVPLSHLLYGSDYSYFPIAHSVAQLQALHLPDPDFACIAQKNAAALLTPPTPRSS